MNTPNLLTYFITLSFILLSCKNGSEFHQEKQNQLLYYYDEQQCDNPWDDVQAKNVQATEVKKTKLQTYLEQNEIEWELIDVKEKNLEMVCAACSCQTGLRFYISVNDKFSEKITKIGFKKQN